MRYLFMNNYTTFDILAAAAYYAKDSMSQHYLECVAQAMEESGVYRMTSDELKSEYGLYTIELMLGIA